MWELRTHRSDERHDADVRVTLGSVQARLQTRVASYKVSATMSGASSPSSVRFPSESISLPPSSTAPTSPGHTNHEDENEGQTSAEEAYERVFDDEVSLQIISDILSVTCAITGNRTQV